MATTVELLAGIFTLLPILIGYSMGVLTLYAYKKSKSTLILLSSIMFFSLPSPWLGTSTIFILQVFNLPLLSDTAYVFLYAWSPAIIAFLWNYTSLTIIKTKQWIKYSIMIFITIIDLIFLYSIYIVRQFTVRQVPDSIFYDSTFTGMANWTSTIIVLTVILFVGPMYLWVSFNTDSPIFRFKTRSIGIGAFLFAIAAGIDANIELSDIGIIILIRFMLVLSLILLYLGYNTPDFVRNRYN